MSKEQKIALGGGCHWCTEAVFQSLKGVTKVEQGYVASIKENEWFSEAVIVYFKEAQIPLKALIEIHLHTHKSTSNHTMRNKYRSAVYFYTSQQGEQINAILKGCQREFNNQIITKSMLFNGFKPSSEAIQNYYKKNPEKPFCKQYINPKLKLLRSKYSNYIKLN
ncbi:peptide-methionine (S)-S-oxide reductase MsrA [Postechiella marina]|uniref:peptide-methionine (S)-S-oxide reductase n=1 Tax=Postechiella marina TaxID=943941 RepID=A0ABP8CFP6_9FLAO